MSNSSSELGLDDFHSDATSDSSTDDVVCTKLMIADNVLACMENRELGRAVEEIKCDGALLENVMTNYVIAKNIISHLSWQEKFICKHVCSMWHSAVLAIQREQLEPSDFVMDLPIAPRINVKFKKSGNFYTEPLAVFTFVNLLGFSVTNKCEAITPHPCNPICKNSHSLMDVVQHNVCVPKDCMIAVSANFLTYMPLNQSVTYEHIFTRKMFIHTNPFICGVYIPMIPDVEFKVINLNSVANMQNDFFDVVRQIGQDRIFKGIIVYVTDIYLLQTMEDIAFLDYLKDVQPNNPYALGGCIVDDTMYEKKNFELIFDGNPNLVTGNLITVAMFTIPKDSNLCNFDVYSLIVESSDWAKAKIKKTIDEFAKRVPRFEHSVAFKFSCVGRDQKHEVEQEYFRAAFPYTRIIGCYGNGELGVNHPYKPPVENVPSSVKRHRRIPMPQLGIVYSYSTVFMYLGWGKKTMPEVI